MTSKKCKLCTVNPPIENSHIIPKLVARAVAKECAGPRFREFNEPNKIEQDIITHPLLCRSCEKRFSKLETHFANKAFLPYFSGGTCEILFDQNTYDALVSVSWRTLAFLQDKNKIPISERIYTNAEITLRNYLRGTSKDIGHHRLYLILSEDIDQETIKTSKALTNTHLRYQIGLCATVFDYGTVFQLKKRTIFSKLGPFMLYFEALDTDEFFSLDDPWKSAEIRPGLLRKAGAVTPPKEIVKNIDNLLSESDEKMQNLSLTQKEKQQSFVEKNLHSSKANTHVQKDKDLFNTNE